MVARMIDRPRQPEPLSQAWRCECGAVLGAVQGDMLVIKRDGRLLYVRFSQAQQQCRCGRWNTWTPPKTE